MLGAGRVPLEEGGAERLGWRLRLLVCPVGSRRGEGIAGSPSSSSRFSDRYLEGTRLVSLDSGAPGRVASEDLGRVGECGEMMDVVALSKVEDNDVLMS